MINAVLALEKFQQIAAVSRSRAQRMMLTSLLTDIRANRVYALGADTDDATAIFTDPDRTIYSYMLTKARPRHRPAYQVSIGRCGGTASLQDWALMYGLTKYAALDCANQEDADVHRVIVLGEVSVSLLITVAESAYTPIFLIPQELTPMQGLAAIYRAVCDRETYFSQLLIGTREVQQ